MATTLGSKAVGSIVKLKVDGTARNFIVVHQGRPSSIYDASCDGTWLLMQDCCEKRQWHSRNANDYANSTIHSYLNGEFLKKFDANIQDTIKQVKIPYRPGSGADKTISSGENGLPAKIFLLSCAEVSIDDNNDRVPIGEGAVLSYFESVPSNMADPKRISTLDGTAVCWWLRTPYVYDAATACSVGSTGGLYAMVSLGCVTTYGIRPALVLPYDTLVSDDGFIGNTAPTTPRSISVPSEISGGTTISVSWAASSDAEGNLAGYIVEKSTNGGSTWTEIYRAQSTATSTNDNVVFGTASVMYRVKAFDTEGLESGWRTSSNITVTNNRAPTAPASITVPLTVQGGADLVISWGAATDSDGNLAGYELERWRYGGAGWEQIFRGNARAFTDHIEKGWTVVFYRVRAYDSNNAYSGYTTSQERMVNNNTAPVITCGYPSGSDLGTKAYGFTVDYSVNDEDGDAVTATEAIDGVTKRTFQATLKQNYSFQVTGETFMKLLNGNHTMTITANDGKASTAHSLTFSKEVTKATITLEMPMEADGEITLAILSVIGSIPADAKYKVEVTNNGKDDLPAWQDVTAEVRAGANIVFANHTAKNGFAFDFRITVERGGSGVGGYITSVQGGFQ